MVGKGGSHRVTLLLERREPICSDIDTDNDTNNNNFHTASGSALSFSENLLSVSHPMCADLPVT